MAQPIERRVPLSRERVLDAALRLADEGGIESLSMRKLAQALGVEAMALYNHVANKDDMLDGIVDLVLCEFELPSAIDSWEAAVRTCAISAHDALLRHRWSCNLIMSSTSVRPPRMRYMEWLLRCLREAGFSAEGASHAYHAIDSHILGFTLWQLGHTMPGGGPRVRNKEELAVFLATLVPTFSPDDYPYLLEHAELHLLGSSDGRESEFEFGLRLILDGLKRKRGTRRGERRE
jgi:AcrR family transcriptional regulator